jgi:hypothetical protein
MDAFGSTKNQGFIVPEDHSCGAHYQCAGGSYPQSLRQRAPKELAGEAMMNRRVAGISLEAGVPSVQGEK